MERLLAPHALTVAMFEARAPCVEIPLPRVVAVMQALVGVERPGWALRGASTLPPGAMGILDHLCAAAPTVDASIVDFSRYFAVVAHGASVTLQRDGDITIELQFDEVPGPMAWMFVESTFGLLWSRLRAYLGRPEIHPAIIELQCPAGSEALDAWAQTLGIAPVPGQPRNRLSVPESLAHEPLVGSNEALRAFLAGLAGDSLPPEPAAEPTWASRVADSVREGRLDADLGQIARALAVSERTLRRRLAEEQTSFSTIRQRERQRRAEALLHSGHLSMGEIAFSLGFSEMSAFNRAFKRWTGTTPGQWRRHE